MLQLIKSAKQRGLRLAVVLVVVAGGTWLAWAEPAPVLLFRELVWDRFVWFKPRAYDESLNVRIVDIDEASLAAHGQWPWPRSRIARLIGALARYKAKVVIFDVFFAEPDATSLAQVFEQLKRDLPGYAPPLSADVIAKQPDNDALMTMAMAKLPVVLGISVNNSGQRVVGHKFQNLVKVTFERRKDQRYLLRFEAGVASLPQLQKAAAANASLDMVVDPDGITRRVAMLFRIGRRNVPTLSASAVAVNEGARLRAGSRRPGLSSVTIGDHLVPTDRQGQMRLYDSGSVNERYISAAQVLDGSAAAKRLAGSIVIVGTGAQGLSDLRLTPLERWAPGMETHAQAIEQILSGIHLVRPDWGHEGEALAIAMVGLLLLAATWGAWQRLPPWLLALVFGAAFLALGWFGFAAERLLLDPVLPAAALLLAAALERFLLVFELRRERAEVRNAFSRYLSPALVEQLAGEPDRLKLGGEMRKMTFLFCDVRGFTSISERFKSDPQGLTRLINRFLTPLSDAILARGGTIDKYMGDCIMAFWNAPLGDGQHAQHACDAALAVFVELEALNGALAAEADAAGRKPIRLDVGVGLNTGECVVGNMGSEQRFDYSVLGDAVNLASRLEGQSKTYGVGIVIGEGTEEAAPDNAALELDLIAVKGRAEAARIFALLGDAALKAGDRFQSLLPAQDELLAAYRAQDWAGARAALARCRELAQAFPELCEFYDLYEARITAYEADPPGPDWDGVFVAESK